jgi:hypothetical protein
MRKNLIFKKKENTDINIGVSQCNQINQEILEDSEFFETVRSRVSCKVSDIKSFVYGGMTSRFWLLRKHLIKNPDIAKKSPLKSWSCITL